MKHLVLIDTRGIKDYVDKRRYLGELRTASKRLESSVDDLVNWMESNYNIKKVYTGGGNALIIMEDPLTDAIKSRLSKEFKDNLDYKKSEYHLPPHLLVDHNEKADELLNQEKFARARLRLLSYIGKVKREFHKNSKETYRPDPNSDLCISCEMRHSTRKVRSYIEDDEEKVCDYCFDLRETGMENLRDEFQTLLEKHEIDRRNFTMADFNKFQLEFFAGKDLEDLKNGETTSTRERLTVVQMDGNLFGDQIAQIESSNELQDISEQVDETMNSNFTNYVNQLSSVDPMDAIRVELGKIYIGGDDLRALMPGRQAVPFANHVSKGFYDKFKSDRKLYLSAGIAAGKPKTPISSLIDLSSYLLKSAKYIHDHDYYGSFDFEVTNSRAFASSIKTHREFQENNYDQAVRGYNFESDFWNLVDSVGGISQLDPSNDPDLIKSSYLNAWKGIQQRFIQNTEKGNNAVALFTVYQAGRANQKDSPTDKYSKAVKLLSGLEDLNDDNSHLQRAIDLLSLRYDI